MMKCAPLKALASLALVTIMTVMPLGNHASGETTGVQNITQSDAGLADKKDTIGLNVALELSSVYCFRGLNVFQESSQMDQNMLWAPGFTWNIFDTGLWFGYWGAFQGRGGNMATLVDAGIGHENDMFFGFDYDIIDDRLTLVTSLTWYFYPFASSDVTGADLPSYLEPMLGLNWSGPVDLGIRISYFAGIQTALSDFRYLYINPVISKTFEFTENVGLAIGLGFGYKLFNDRSRMTDNVYDVRFDWSIPLRVTKEFYVEPAFHAAWTNLTGRSVGQEYLIWAGLSMGVDI